MIIIVGPGRWSGQLFSVVTTRRRRCPDQGPPPWVWVRAMAQVWTVDTRVRVISTAVASHLAILTIAWAGVTDTPTANWIPDTTVSTHIIPKSITCLLLQKGSSQLRSLQNGEADPWEHLPMEYENNPALESLCLQDILMEHEKFFRTKKRSSLVTGWANGLPLREVFH